MRMGAVAGAILLAGNSVAGQTPTVREEANV